MLAEVTSEVIVLDDYGLVVETFRLQIQSLGAAQVRGANCDGSYPKFSPNLSADSA